ncbi:hypothetical protein V6N13_140450 [Hibiscus sabdariffa]|uniref:Uncharacterized protein n=1 Tax=Hibiscus sabdariffa TaxID=183260 RepID=A0ABR2QA14_9ROSI
MGRQGGDPTVVTSSIALLQERFRQLQKDREKREERELLKLLSESDLVGPNMRYGPNRLAGANLPYKQQPHQESSLSLGLSSHGRRPISEQRQSQPHQQAYCLRKLQAHQKSWRLVTLIPLFICSPENKKRNCKF